MNSSTTRQCVARRSRNQRGRKPDSTQRTLRLARSTAESFSFATLGGDLCDLGVKSERRSRSGERTPPACQFGRRARTIVTPSSCAWRWEEVCGTRFSARRRKPHVRGVCSPELGAASSFDFGVRVRTSVPLRQHPVQHLRQPLRGESAMALQPQERTDFSWRTRHRPRQLHIVEA